ncbi:MAG: sulfatase [Nitrospirota bacterium]
MENSPNIVLIVLDTAAAKHMSLYGYHRDTTPELERIAEESVVYTKCFSPGTWTVPSHASLFTGLYPTEHGAFYHTKKYLYPFLYSISDILCLRKYNICGISANSIIDPSTGYLRDCGRFFNIMRPYQGEDTDKAMAFFRGVPFGRKISKVPLFFLKGGNPISFLKALLSSHYFVPTFQNTTPSTKRAVSLIKRTIKSSAEPYFIFVNIMQTHLAYNPPEPFRYKFVNRVGELDRRFRNLVGYQSYYSGRMHFSERDIEYLTGLYDAEMLFTDSILGKLYGELKMSGKLDNTVLIITSDHGEQFGEKGRMGHMQSSVQNSLIHIPLVIRYPDRMGIKGENGRLCQLNDLYATITELVDSQLPVPDSSFSLLSGKRKYSLTQYFFEEDFERERLLKENPKFDWDAYDLRMSQTAYTRDDLWKLIIRSDDRMELYDLNNDFYENNDLYSDRRYEHVLRGITEEALKEIRRIGGEILLK